MTNVLVMSAATDQQLTDATANREWRLNPMPILAGPYAGKSALSITVLNNPHFADLQTTLQAIPIVDLDFDEAWPPDPDAQ